MLDEDVLTLALNTKGKKEKQFNERIGKLYKQYNDRKNAYITARKKVDESNNTTENLRLKILKALAVWKKRKGNEVIPSKHDTLIERWMKTKHRAGFSFEEALEETSIFGTYRKETGLDLSMNIVHAQLDSTSSDDDLDNNETIPIAQPDDNVNVNIALVTEV